MSIKDIAMLASQKLADLISKRFSGKLVLTVNLHNGGITRLTAQYEEVLGVPEE